MTQPSSELARPLSEIARPGFRMTWLEISLAQARRVVYEASIGIGDRSVSRSYQWLTPISFALPYPQLPSRLQGSIVADNACATQQASDRSLDP